MLLPSLEDYAKKRRNRKEKRRRLREKEAKKKAKAEAERREVARVAERERLRPITFRRRLVHVRRGIPWVFGDEPPPSALTVNNGYEEAWAPSGWR